MALVTGGGVFRGQFRGRGFTLTELLVVIGIIAILGSLTVFSVGSIFKDAKMSSGVNMVMAALDNARALAMKNNKITLVAFRSRRTGENEMAVEAVIAEWTGETYGGGSDRYVPVPGAPVRRLPDGIKVAAPSYGTLDDNFWVTSAHLPAIIIPSTPGTPPNLSTSEFGGVVVAVMYNGRGEVITSNSESDTTRTFVDFNDNFLLPNGGQNELGVNYTYVGTPDEPSFFFFFQYLDEDEPYVTTAPFIAVYDDDAARETYDTSQWIGSSDPFSDSTLKTENLTEYITAHAKRIHFNRYTGVAMK